MTAAGWAPDTGNPGIEEGMSKVYHPDLMTPLTLNSCVAWAGANAATGHSWRIRVAIIGSGFSGIAAAVALQRAGIEDFTIFEMSDGVGGTWWSNRYPGAEVDLESSIYSFSFAPADWTRTHASWREIQHYLESVVDRLGLRSQLVLGEKVEEIRWSPEHAGLAGDDAFGARLPRFTAVISAVGFLNVPRLPDLGGAERFDGVACHTSCWPPDLDLAGKRVGILGTGSSAVQVAAEAARSATELKIFQSSPNWIVPKGARDFTDAERGLHRRRRIDRLRRLHLYLQYDARQYRSSHARPDGRVNTRRRAVAKSFLEARWNRDRTSGRSSRRRLRSRASERWSAIRTTRRLLRDNV